MRQFLFAVAGAVTTGVAWAGPIVSNVSMTQSGDRVVTVTYHLAGAPAIVTLDIETNGVTIGDANVYRRCPPSGDVSRLIREDGDYSITWRADRAWPDHKVSEAAAQPVVTAWPPSAPPDYLVADLTVASNVCYYTSSNALPRGLFGDDAYRTTKMVMRRIHAKNIPWTMGSIGEKNRESNETPYAVTLDSDYYLAVFPVTQGQYAAITGERPSAFMNEGFWAKRIYELLTLGVARENPAVADNSAYFYPNDPYPNSYLGKIRKRTGVLFDLPGEAQWEFACRAGRGDGVWGDGRIQSYPGGSSDIASITVAAATCDDTEGTPTAGSYPPNGFGLYDMIGGVAEFCLDWYEADITGLNGAINAAGTKTLSGATGAHRVVKGGSWYRGANYARAARRDGVTAGDSGGVVGAGFRSARLAASIPAEE